MGKRDLKGPKGEYKKSSLYLFAFMVATVDACLITRNYIKGRGHTQTLPTDDILAIVLL